MKTNYNAYFRTKTDQFNLLVISEEKLKVIIDSYLEGKDSFTLSGRKYEIENLQVIKIYTYDYQMSATNFRNYCIRNNLTKKLKTRHLITPRNLQLFGKNVTDELLGNKEHGENRSGYRYEIEFINNSRIAELLEIDNSRFDLRKLIQLCIEINSNYSNENYLSVGILCRILVDHIPPIFECSNFSQVASNYGSKSFKECMTILNNTMRKIADGYLHTHIRKKETLPNETQIDFKQPIDLLLGEIVRMLKE